jgi:hypothetical protein
MDAGNFELRRPMLPIAVWAAVLMPGAVLVLMPALLELLEAISAARRRATA